MLKPITFTLVKGKEVPPSFDGTVVRGRIPTTFAEMREVCGGSEEVAVSVFNEGYTLNHIQKPAKRASALKDASIVSIQKAVDDHKPGVRTERGSGGPTAGSKIRDAASTLLEAATALEKVNPELAAKYRAKAAALTAKTEKKPVPVVAPAADGSTAAAAIPKAENVSVRKGTAPVSKARQK